MNSVPRQAGRARHAMASAAIAAGLSLCMLLAAGQGRAEEADPHAHHHMMMAAADSGTQRSEANYEIPDLQLVRENGKSVSMRSEIDDGRPVYVNFIFTTCTTICPLSSQVFSQLQQKLGDNRDKVHLVSISIDPEMDTPARLRAYAARFHAGKGWSHYTGTYDASIAAQRAFNAYRGDKMNHAPLTLFRPAPGKPWVRLDGFATPDELLALYASTSSGSTKSGGT